MPSLRIKRESGRERGREREGEREEEEAVMHSFILLQVSGADVRDELLRTGLPNTILAQIWGLADMHQTGTLNQEQFALVSVSSLLVKTWFFLSSWSFFWFYESTDRV